jgi:hypothetical protein
MAKNVLEDHSAFKEDFLRAGQRGAPPAVESWDDHLTCVKRVGQEVKPA